MRICEREECGNKVVGRPDKRFCSTKCKNKASSLSRAARYRQAHPEYSQAIAYKWNAARWAALRRGHKFTLTKLEVARILKAPCAYGENSATISRLGLDRKNSKQGYTAENCVSCCARHNLMKGHWFSHEQMLAVIRAHQFAADCGDRRKQ